MSHCALGIDEILSEVIAWVVDTHPPTAVSLACCAKSFEEPALRALWTTQKELPTLIKALPPDCWEARPPKARQGKTEITLARTPSKDEWIRVRRYGSWMRTIGPSYMTAISNDVFQQLSFATSGGPICPQLQHLTWTSACGYEHCQLFLSPNLVSVVFWHSTNNFRLDLGLDSAISPLPTTRLEKLCLTGYPPYTAPIHSALSEAVQRLNNCFKQIDVKSSLSDAAWGHLASLPKLESLCVADTPSIEVLKSIDLGHTFLALKRMTLELNGQHQHLAVLFSLFKSSSLEEVVVDESTEIQHVGVPAEVALAMLKAKLRTSVSTLAFDRFHPANVTFVSHLGPFSSLKALKCGTRCQEHRQCGFPLMDADIERLASGLPQLVTLYLGHKCWYSHPSTTIKSVMSLSTHCPSLGSIHLPCNLTNISEDVKMESGELDPRLKTRSSCALEFLAFDWMTRTKDREASELMKSSVRHLFPRFRFT